MEDTLNLSWLNGHVDIRGLKTTTDLLHTSHVCALPPFLLSLYLHHYEVNIFHPHFTWRNLRCQEIGDSEIQKDVTLHLDSIRV